MRDRLVGQNHQVRIQIGMKTELSKWGRNAWLRRNYTLLHDRENEAIEGNDRKIILVPYLTITCLSVALAGSRNAPTASSDDVGPKKFWKFWGCESLESLEDSAL